MTNELTTLAGALGDVFWDLPPWITYVAGSELGVTVYVANPTDEEKEYALMARLTTDTTVVSEESVTVFGHAWFRVDPEDWLRLHGALRFDVSDVTLTVLLYEKESGEVVDSVSTALVAPTPAAWPPWPGAPGAPGAPGFDWSSLFSMMLPIMMIGIVGVMLAKAFRKKEGKSLPEGR